MNIDAQIGSARLIFKLQLRIYQLYKRQNFSG